ncbi:MarR family transcriptional regulator [Glaciihabitans sp. INWT7]|uniref:MarR family winged helix-turn-helix transcriptional regulator n=1 Tax=Glaciihabitans sp. INWT7 TaxID=2596912 RepID=UPI00162547A1|nr:MarR family transcriptional regulator [Glaciihabitans sp. INWT7]QNE48049.1 MarR family transcriptional regulator [Glaciihabitans sp. INWT7]
MTDPVGMQGWPTGRLLSTAARLVEHAWVEALEQLGLSHAGLIVLHVLGSGPRSQTELAKSARVEVQTMSRTLERLEREGYIAREKHPDDGRRHVVTRTAAGEAAWESARTLEADLFPSIADNAGMRASLLEIIQATAADRWDVE